MYHIDIQNNPKDILKIHSERERKTSFGNI